VLHHAGGGGDGRENHQSVMLIIVDHISSDGGAVFSLVSSVAAVHAIREAMRLLKTTGTDFASAKGMDPKAFFEVMGMHPLHRFVTSGLPEHLFFLGLENIVQFDAQAGGSAYKVI
jgi:hypothetical protein